MRTAMETRCERRQYLRPNRYAFKRVPGRPGRLEAKCVHVHSVAHQESGWALPISIFPVISTNRLWNMMPLLPFDQSGTTYPISDNESEDLDSYGFDTQVSLIKILMSGRGKIQKVIDRAMMTIATMPQSSWRSSRASGVST